MLVHITCKMTEGGNFRALQNCNPKESAMSRDDECKSSLLGNQYEGVNLNGLIVQ
jgi:hypothetical protein